MQCQIQLAWELAIHAPDHLLVEQLVENIESLEGKIELSLIDPQKGHYFFLLNLSCNTSAT